MATAATASIPACFSWPDDLGFRIRLCRPYRARTKGKVERFNRYLRESFYNPLHSRVKAAGLRVDCGTANRLVGDWLAAAHRATAWRKAS